MQVVLQIVITSDTLLCPAPNRRGIKRRFCLTPVAYIVNIHGAHSYQKQGALGAAGQA